MKFSMDVSDLQDIISAVDSVRSEGDRTEAIVEFQEDRWLLKSVGPSTVVSMAAMVPEDSMESYDPGEVDKLGIKFGVLKNFFSGSSGTGTVFYDEEEYKMYLDDGQGLQMEMATVQTDQVNGYADDLPDINHPVAFEGDLSFLTQFIAKADNTVDSGSVTMAAREKRLYLYANQDLRTITYQKKWSDIGETEINWEDGQGTKTKCDVCVSVDYLTAIHKPQSEGKVKLGHNWPVKMVFETENGIPIAYFIAPRTASDGGELTIPDSVIEDDDK